MVARGDRRVGSVDRLPDELGELDHEVDAAADDLVIEGEGPNHGQRVLVDPVSLPYLAGAVIDFADELIGARFVIDNPNAPRPVQIGRAHV